MDKSSLSRFIKVVISTSLYTFSQIVLGFLRFRVVAMINHVGVAYYDVEFKIQNNSTCMFVSFRLVFFPHMLELFVMEKHEKATKVLNNSLHLI